MRAIRLIAAGISLALLAGCEPDAQSVATVCQALQGPIYYNSYVLTSRRHAGPDLAIDLHQRNLVWLRLHCGRKW